MKQNQKIGVAIIALLILYYLYKKGSFTENFGFFHHITHHHVNIPTKHSIEHSILHPGLRHAACVEKCQLGYPSSQRAMAATICDKKCKNVH